MKLSLYLTTGAVSKPRRISSPESVTSESHRSCRSAPRLWQALHWLLPRTRLGKIRRYAFFWRCDTGVALEISEDHPRSSPGPSVLQIRTQLSETPPAPRLPACPHAPHHGKRSETVNGPRRRFLYKTRLGHGASHSTGAVRHQPGAEEVKTGRAVWPASIARVVSCRPMRDPAAKSKPHT